MFSIVRVFFLCEPLLLCRCERMGGFSLIEIGDTPSFILFKINEILKSGRLLLKRGKHSNWNE
jgi:hypothetical protein